MYPVSTVSSITAPWDAARVRVGYHEVSARRVEVGVEKVVSEVSVVLSERWLDHASASSIR